jgi:P27 family predicted phage terminase small subunit
LKLLVGERRASRLRDDRPKINELPRVPPGIQLAPDERAMWDYLMETIVVPGVHGAGDGGTFAMICKTWARYVQCCAKIEKFGLVMKSPSGKPEVQPYARMARDLEAQLRLALADIGATPGGRARIAGPHSTVRPRDPTAWDEFD